MSVIQYKCDICDRIIDIPQNKKGLEIIQKCVITDGCHGKLSQIDIKLDHIRGSFPDKVDNLDDYIRRKILYNHTQSIKLNEWIITHDLGVSPIIQVFIEVPKFIENLQSIDLENVENLVELKEVVPAYINIISANSVIIGFDNAEKGIAQLISKTSNSDKLKVKDLSSSSIIYRTVTTDSEVTIGTLVDDSVISLEFTFILPSGLIKTVIYNVDSNPSIKSPWVDYNKIYNGRTYTVRSFNIFDEDFSSIENGSAFYISKLNGLPLNDNDILLLLTKSPYSTNDKITNEYLNISSINIENALDDSLYINGIFQINESKFTKVYPYIKKV